MNLLCFHGNKYNNYQNIEPSKMREIRRQGREEEKGGGGGGGADMIISADKD